MTMVRRPLQRQPWLKTIPRRESVGGLSSESDGRGGCAWKGKEREGMAWGATVQGGSDGRDVVGGGCTPLSARVPATNDQPWSIHGGFIRQISFNGTRAVGVNVLYNNASRGKINARKEVILCAGTVNTVQLLLLSGIGPRKDLNKYQIRTVSDLPEVGKNLFDHMNVPVYVNLKAPVSLTLKKMQSIQEVAKYLLFGTGSLSSNRVLATARVNNSGIILFGMASTDEKLLKDIANYQTETFRSLFPAYNDTAHEGFLYLATCLRPKSRGNVTLKSRSIFDQPKIDPAYLQNDYDVRCTHEAINLAVETLNSPKFREFGARVHFPDFEECRHFRQDYRDQDYSECVMRIAGVTSHHPCGTCRMGTDDNSVVDEKLRVRGVIGLRIMDASILPSPISGTPNSVLIAMAERAFDVITERTSN
ncbi:hypothetical protein HZH68_008361 [Vespula germanica]|uniref:Uncharacterized protein n=1 Tax=Vespula germanica TaxID=30212 RepID=A0A834N9F1_VESGE|nr:hypothetical protein HZH68_008361 [Vespula germanica]